MIGNLIILGLSWILLRLEKCKLQLALGFNNTGLRLLQFIFGFLATALLAILLSMVFALSANFNWVPSQNITASYLLNGIYTVFNSVVYEELIFRGYLLYKAIKLIGERKAILLSAAAFGVYHWFSFGIFGNPILMVWVFFFTGIWGLMFAKAYARTHSLALPFGLHFGWNLIDQYGFSDKQLSLFEPVTSIHTKHLSMLESMLYVQLPTIAFAVIVIVILSNSKRLAGVWRKAEV